MCVEWIITKGLVFDLAQKKEEDMGIIDFEILKDIEYCYVNRRVPILIHSAYALKLEKLKEYPSVLLYEKSGRSQKKLRADLKILEVSGFLDLFYEGPMINDEVKHLVEKVGLEEQVVKTKLHSHFTKSFSDNNLLNDLSKIISESKDPKRDTFLKYLSPAIEELKS